MLKNKHYKILIVDDNTTFIQAFKTLLYNVLGDSIDCFDFALNGEEGLSKLKQKPYDYIFMDVNMPVMGGIEAAKIADQKYIGLNIVALTFHQEIEVMEDMFSAGARYYISKPDLNHETLLNLFNKNT